MQITKVRIKFVNDGKASNEQLQAFCSVTFDDAFVIHDLKIIEGDKGLFVVMPSRKLTDRCPHCGSKNHLRACYCNHCGKELGEDRSARHANGKARISDDIVHPINSVFRELIKKAVLEAYYWELDHPMRYGCVSSSFNGPVNA